MKKQNSDKKLTKLGDYLKCNFFKSNKRAYNRFNSINIYKKEKLELLIRKTNRKIKNKKQNIFELVNFEELLLNNYKKKKEEPIIIKSKDEKSKYINENILLGKGGFGQCYLFRSIDKEDMNFYAGKIIKKEKVGNNRKSLLDEINIQKKFKDNPKIVKVKDYFEDDENVYIILELCKNKSLANYLEERKGPLKEIEVKCFIFQLLQGLKCLRKEKIIHRDLKPNNLLLDDKNELKIGDFGLVVKITNDKERMTETCGTYCYMAPEIYENNGKGYSIEVDIWSVGIIMYQLLTNKLLFIGKDFDSIKEKILAFQPENLDVSGLSDIAADLIKQILVKDPKQRPGINQILYHYFFHDIEFPKYITPEILEKIDKEENKKENKKENIKNLNVKLYTLIVDDIPEIKYEDIKNYVLRNLLVLTNII
jgi:serine/threonine protein kinase